MNSPERTDVPAATAAGAPGTPGRRRSHSGYWMMGIGAVVVLVLAGSFVARTLWRQRHGHELEAAAALAANGPPRVTVATARRAPPTSELILPGNALPWRDASLYARATGYLKRWLVDIDDRVTEGQLLAEISAPDVDDQLAQARANLVLAKANLQVSEANLALAQITLDRDLRPGPARQPRCNRSTRTGPR